MDELAEVLRPRSFQEVIGQDEAVHDLTGFIKRGERRNILIYGSSGSGKTSLGFLYAAAQYCEAEPSMIRPCGRCTQCLDLAEKNIPAFFSLRGPALTLDHVRYLMEDVQREKSLFDPHYIYLVDEARGMSQSVCEMFQIEMERPKSPAIFIFLTILAGDLPLPLRERCAEIKLRSPNRKSARQFLQRACETQHLSAEPDALDLLALTATDFRGLAQNLQRLTVDGAVHLDAVRSRFCPGAENVHAYLHQVLCSDGTAALDWDNETTPSAVEFAAAMQSFLNDLRLLMLDGAANRKPYELAPASVHPDSRMKLAVDFSKLAQANAIDADGLLQDAHDFWAHMPTGMTRGQLIAEVLQFRRWARRRMTLSVPQVAPGTKTSRRAVNQAVRHPLRSAHLSYAQAHQIYECATFLIQEYGATFNLRLVIDCSSESLDQDKLIARRVGALLNKLHGRLKCWDRGPALGLSYVVVYERHGPAALRATVVGHVAGQRQTEAAQWLNKRLAGLAEALKVEVALDAPRAGPASVKRHWDLVRELWGGLSGEDLVADGRSLQEVLRVPVSQRRALGVVGCRRFATSTSIATGRREEAASARLAHLSAFDDQAWAWLFVGWESKEFFVRSSEKRARDRQIADLESRFPVREGYEGREFVRRLAQLRESWPEDPRLRVRDWGSWKTGGFFAKAPQTLVKTRS